jgi:tetratricopeptide (TPR) repeat protein
VDLAKIEASEGNFEASRAGFSRALTAARSVKGRLVECAALNGLGSACVDQGRFDEARTHYSHALLIAREVGDRHWEGGLLGNLGNVHAALGRFEDARADYEDGLRTAREIGDRRWEGNALSNLGLLSDEQGRPAEALPQFETALRIAREIGHRKLEGKVLCNLGLAHQSLEQTAQAQANFEAAVAVAQAVGDRQTQGQALGYLGLMLAKQGRFDAARDHLSNGADMLRAISSRFDLGLLLCARAEAEILGGNSGAALGALAESTAIATEIDAESTTESELALALRRVRQLVSRPSHLGNPKRLSPTMCSSYSYSGVVGGLRLNLNCRALVKDAAVKSPA